MQLVVIADSEMQEEFHKKGIPEDVEVHFEIAATNAKQDADAYFYLLPEENLKEDLAVFEKIKEPVFANAVVRMLDELPSNFIRLNGWSGFIQRRILEVAAAENNFQHVARVLGALKWKFQLVPDVPGLFAARVVSMVVNEAYFALEDEVSTKPEIDVAMKLGTNYPYGPFEWSERIGLQNIFDLLSRLSKTDERYTAAPFLI